jgi:hypothetical protein
VVPLLFHDPKPGWAVSTLHWVHNVGGPVASFLRSKYQIPTHEAEVPLMVNGGYEAVSRVVPFQMQSVVVVRAERPL